MQKPIVISGDFLVSYYTGEPKGKQSPTIETMILERHWITVWDDLSTIPSTLIDYYKKNIEKEISKRLIKTKFKITDFAICNFHFEQGKANYTPKEGWVPYK